MLRNSVAECSSILYRKVPEVEQIFGTHRFSVAQMWRNFLNTNASQIAGRHFLEVRSGIANGIFAGYVSPKKIAKMLIFKIYWILMSILI